ncbi:MAG: extensin family protein [Sphingobium sp.]|nr:extensin family protein [Sphingobium sp.]
MLSRCRGLRSLRVAALLALAGLAGCVSMEGPQRPRAVKRVAQPSRPKPNGPEFGQCLARLDAAMVRFSVLPNQDKGGGCAIIDAVKLLDIGTPTTNLGALTCDLAGNFAAWARYAVRPAARVYLGVEVVRIETFGTYACRDVRGSGGTIAGRLSEHALANAVDVSAFLLADGRRITVADDWYADGPTSQFLHVIHDSACKRFRTVLSPDYNSAHRDHLHFDMGGKGGYCR